MGVRPPDLEHFYGHSKFEQVAALGITLMMFVACFNILHEAMDRAIAKVVPNVTLLLFMAIVVFMLISLSYVLNSLP